MPELNLPVVVIGFGGHGRVVASALLAAGAEIACATDLDPANASHARWDFDVVSDADLESRFSPDQVLLALGVGSIWPTKFDDIRPRIVAQFEQLGYRFTGVVHPQSWVAPSAAVSDTAQIHAGAVVQPGTVVGDFSILNTRCSVDHDCRLASYCHIGPGATLSGEVEVGWGSHIGTGASVIQGRKLGDHSFVGAGATVVNDIQDGVFVRGVPARQFIPTAC